MGSLKSNKTEAVARKQRYPVMKKRPVSYLAALLILGCLSYLWTSCSFKQGLYRVPQLVTSPALTKPSSIVRFKGRYVATGLQSNRLSCSEDLSFGKATYLDPADIGQSFSSPHFLAVTPWDTLLISNGWGKSIVEITGLDGSGWKEFRGDDRGFNAPHGLCVDKAGWIYVGDSLNSRLVRFRDMKGSDFQEFADLEQLIAYSRQLVCKDGAVWVSNSYEAREGLNRGAGANVLRIDNYTSGRAEVVYANPATNITGILPLNSTLLVAEWMKRQQIVAVDLLSGEHQVIDGSRCELGAPYGLFEEKDGSVLAAYFGDFKKNRGGIARFRR